MTSLRSSRGVTVLSAIVAVLILAAMGGAMAIMVATNQETRSYQYYADQSFASAQAGLELILGSIYWGANPCDSMNRNLNGDNPAGNNVITNRANNRIYVTGTKGASTTVVSVVDPSPPTNDTILVIDASQAEDASNGGLPMMLTGITLQLIPGCGGSVTITSLVISWVRDNGEMVQQIQIDGTDVYSVGYWDGKLSGETIDIRDVTIADANLHMVDFIRWNTEIQNRLYTIQFNFADGSSKTVTVDTR